MAHRAVGAAERSGGRRAPRLMSRSQLAPYIRQTGHVGGHRGPSASAETHFPGLSTDCCCELSGMQAPDGVLAAVGVRCITQPNRLLRCLLSAPSRPAPADSSVEQLILLVQVPC
jgi:hypothetical protein